MTTSKELMAALEELLASDTRRTSALHQAITNRMATFETEGTSGIAALRAELDAIIGSTDAAHKHLDTLTRIVALIGIQVLKDHPNE